MRRKGARTASACSRVDSGNLRREGHLPVRAVDLSIYVGPGAPQRSNRPTVVHDHAKGVKTGRRLAVKAHGRFMKRMPGPALAGLERLDARSPKTGYGTGIPASISPSRRSGCCSGMSKAYPPVSDLSGTSPIDDGFENVNRRIDELQVDVRELRTLVFSTRNEDQA